MGHNQRKSKTAFISIRLSTYAKSGVFRPGGKLMKFTKINDRKYKVGRDAKGSNQYRRKPKSQFKSYFGLMLLLILGGLYVQKTFHVDLQIDANAPTTDKAYALVLPTVTPTPDEKQEIRDYIKTVFGKDSDKAFKLLKCENASLNPKAINTAGNFPEGSRDIGVFQINEYWQDVNAKFLFDPKINVQIAYKIFKDDGSFKMWSCSRKI